jgi:hypothetical protein
MVNLISSSSRMKKVHIKVACPQVYRHWQMKRLSTAYYTRVGYRQANRTQTFVLVLYARFGIVRRLTQYHTTASCAIFSFLCRSFTIFLIRATMALPYSGPRGGAGLLVSGLSQGIFLIPADALRISSISSSL